MVARPDVKYPKFKDQFAAMDFEAQPLPVLSLYPMPEPKALEDWSLPVTGLTGNTSVATSEHLKKLPKVQEATPLVCQIFNWSETPVVTGVRLPQLLVLQRRFFDLVSFWPDIASRKARPQGCHGRGQVAMKRRSRSLSREASL